MTARPRKRFGLQAAALTAAAAADPELKISGLDATPVREPSSGRAYIVVRISTAGGPLGFGEAPATPDPQTASARIEKLGSKIRGMDALSAMVVDLKIADEPARGAVNMALLDILGKVTEAPLYEALGGPTRHKVRAMAVLSEATVAEVRRAYAAGHRAFSIPLEMPDGPGRGREFYDRVQRTLESLRDAVGEESDFVLDCAGKTTPAEALSIADRLESFHLLWMDEPAPGSLNAAAPAALSRGTVTAMGYGREIVDNGRFQDLLREDAIDVLRPDISRNGITQIKKAAALAEVYYVAVAPYNRGGPIATAAAIHLAAALPNSFITEVPFPVDAADREMRDSIGGEALEKADDGYFALPPGYGLGVEVSDAALRKYVI